MLSKKKKPTPPIPQEEPRIILDLPEGYPLSKVYVTEKKLHEIRICLHSLLRNGMLGPHEQIALKKIFGKNLAAFEAKELLEIVDEKLR